MSTRKQREKEAKRQSRIHAGEVLAAVKPTPSREEVAKQVMAHLDARILEIRKSLIQIERMLLTRRWRGLLAGLAGR